MENSKENQETAITVIEKHIQSKDFDNLVPALNLAKDLTLPNKLLCEGHILCGDHFFEVGNYDTAINHLNIARSRDRKNESLYEKCLNALTAFYETNLDKFIADDLKNLLSAVSLMKNQSYINALPSNIATKISTIEKSMRLQSHIAPNEVEGKMTFRVAQIVNTFTKYHTFDDVLEHFVLFAEDDLRALYEEEEKKNPDKESPKKKPKKKKEDDSDKKA
jgi:hypothetical protein